MVSKNLRVGDIFKDGKRTYRVLEIVPGVGYNAELLPDETNAVTVTIEEVNSEKEIEITKEMLENMTRTELVKIAKKLKLETKGKTIDLVERITETLK